MPISKLIEFLQQVQERVGDVEVELTAQEAIVFSGKGIYIDLEREIVVN